MVLITMMDEIVVKVLLSLVSTGNSFTNMPPLAFDVLV